MELATIGYEAATPASFLESLQAAGIDVVVDVRAVANSRRPGFAKRSLAARLGEVGIEYLHLRGLGTPAEGRAAARGGDHDELRRIYLAHLQTSAAQDDLSTLANLVSSGRRACVLCLEADPAHCHRSMVAEAVRARIGATPVHLRPQAEHAAD